MKRFLVDSYRYIAPRGTLGHLRFLTGLPGAAWRYWRLSRK
jgi:hypothetical protein